MNCPRDRTPTPCQYPDCCRSDSGVLDGDCLCLNGPASPGIGLNLIGGRQIDLRNPSLSSIRLQDIAGALSKLCRFAGHVPEFYSVAQHSVLVALALPPRLQLAGLLHDGSEAYMNDITRALKHSPEMAPYRVLEDRMQRAIFRAFGLPEEMSVNIKNADRALAEIEFDQMLRGEQRVRKEDEVRWRNGAYYLPGCDLPIAIVPLLPDEAERLFLKTYDRIMSEVYHSLRFCLDAYERVMAPLSPDGRYVEIDA